MSHLPRTGITRNTPEQATIDNPLRSHVFRHSFADFLRRSKVDVTRIKDDPGKGRIATTQGYMEDFGQSAVDEM